MISKPMLMLCLSKRNYRLKYGYNFKHLKIIFYFHIKESCQRHCSKMSPQVMFIIYLTLLNIFVLYKSTVVLHFIFIQIFTVYWWFLIIVTK